MSKNVIPHKDNRDDRGIDTMKTRDGERFDDRGQTNNSLQLDEICENFIDMVMDFYDIAGIAVGVHIRRRKSCDGKIKDLAKELMPYTFTGAGGYRNYETKEPVQADTVFHCTSVSKLFTAMGVMKLAEQGKLALSDRLSDVVPWMSVADKRWEDITIESMLTHTSGLTDVSDYRWEDHKTADDSLKEYALSEEVAGRKLLWEPVSASADMPAEAAAVDLSKRFRYSSMAYDLLGLVIAEVSGVTFEEFMKREIFGPLGMNNTTFMTFDRVEEYVSDVCGADENSESKCDDKICEEFLQAADQAELAMPHGKGRDRAIRIEEAYPYTRQHAPSSTLTSTAGDLLKWAGRLIECANFAETSEVIETMWQPRVTVPDTEEQMGLGWFVRKQEAAIDLYEGDASELREYTLVGHEGSDDGFRTSFWMCPELGIATVLLCNLTDAPLKKLNKKLFNDVIKMI